MNSHPRYPAQPSHATEQPGLEPRSSTMQGSIMLSAKARNAKRPPGPWDVWHGLRRGSCLFLLGLLACAGCERPSPPPGASPAEPAPESSRNSDASRDSQDSQWQSQIAAVLAGESDAVQVTTEQVAVERLADLRRVPGVTELLIDAGTITDQGVEFIAPLAKLEHLRLRQSPLTDAGLAQLAAGRMENLRILNLPQAEVTAFGIEHLAALPSLVQLRLGGAGLDDRAAEAIAALPALRSLHLINPSLTSVGLDHLAKSPRLSSLYIDGCELSDEAWERLFAAKPSLHVHVDQAHHDRDPHHHPHP